MLTTPKPGIETPVSTYDPHFHYVWSVSYQFFSDSLIKFIVLCKGAMTRVSTVHQKRTSKWNSSYVSLLRNPFSIVAPFYFHVHVTFSYETSAVKFRFDVSALADVAECNCKWRLCTGCVTYGSSSYFSRFDSGFASVFVFKYIISGCNMKIEGTRMFMVDFYLIPQWKNVRYSNHTS